METEFKIGDIIWNGFYHIKLISEPVYNETQNRWFANGKRYVVSTRKFERKAKQYGWVTEHAKYSGDIFKVKY